MLLHYPCHTHTLTTTHTRAHTHARAHVHAKHGCDGAQKSLDTGQRLRTPDLLYRDKGMREMKGGIEGKVEGEMEGGCVVGVC